MGVVLGIDFVECTIQYLDDNKVEYSVHIDEIRVIQDDAEPATGSSREIQSNVEEKKVNESAVVQKKPIETKKSKPISQATFAAIYKEFTV